MQNDPLISPQLEKTVGTVEFLGLMRDPWNILSHMLFKLSERYHREKNFDESLFKSLFKNFEEFISSNSFLILIIAPLHNFDSECELIKLDNEVTIRKITNYEKERLLRAAEDLRVTPIEITQLKYVIEHKFKSDKLVYDPNNNPRRRDKEKTLKAIITAMHLFKKGAVNYITRQSESKFEFPGLAGGIESYTSQCPLPGETYILTKSEINKFRRFWNFFKEIDYSNIKPLDLILRRFNFAYERAFIEDKFLDYMISYETLFSKEDDSPDSITHKLALRFSHLYKQQQSDRGKHYGRMKKKFTVLEVLSCMGSES
jgi:Apea-like HEPN